MKCGTFFTFIVYPDDHSGNALNFYNSQTVSCLPAHVMVWLYNFFGEYYGLQFNHGMHTNKGFVDFDEASSPHKMTLCAK